MHMVRIVSILPFLLVSASSTRPNASAGVSEIGLARLDPKAVDNSTSLIVTEPSRTVCYKRQRRKVAGNTTNIGLISVEKSAKSLSPPTDSGSVVISAIVHAVLWILVIKEMVLLEFRRWPGGVPNRQEMIDFMRDGCLHVLCFLWFTIKYAYKRLRSLVYTPS